MGGKKNRRRSSLSISSSVFVNSFQGKKKAHSCSSISSWPPTEQWMEFNNKLSSFSQWPWESALGPKKKSFTAQSNSSCQSQIHLLLRVYSILQSNKNSKNLQSVEEKKVWNFSNYKREQRLKKVWKSKNFENLELWKSKSFEK